MPLPQTSAGTVPRQTPATQVSFVVHALPSLHGPLIARNVQPPRPSQLSAVQTLSSLHEYGVPLHTPSTHLSSFVHASPSVQGFPRLQDTWGAIAAVSAWSLLLTPGPTSSPSARVLQTADLISEAYLKLVHVKRTAWKDRVHFFAVASRAMRSVLVDYARAGLAMRSAGVMP
jgi:hypothetical protein